jgi:replicative DNA helicase
MSDFPPPPDLDELTPVEDVQTQPHSRQAEEAVIGSVLINPESYYDLAQFMSPDDFYIVRNRWVWEAFTSLHEKRAPIDYLTVCESLDQAGQLGEVGGPAYIMALINQTPTSLHAVAYGHIVEDNAVRRRMLQSANDLARLAYDRTKTIDTIIDDAEKSIFGVGEKRVHRDLVPIKQVLSEYYDRVDQLSQRSEEIYGVPTGLIDLDHLLGGLQKSDLLIIAGRPGMGKTGFMLSVVKNAAQKHKKHVAMFSLEMSNEQLVQRLIAQETGIDTQRLRTGKLNEDEWSTFTHAIEVLADTHIFLDDTPAITPMALRTKCRRLHLEYGLDLIVVDYLQLMSGDTRNDNRVQEVSYISRNLKVLARELNVPVLTAAQLSRAVEQRTEKKPILSDLRESGCLTGETLVMLASGERKPIASLTGTQPMLVSLNDEWRLVNTKAHKVWLTGHRDVYKLTTKSGRTIRATDNHPFRLLTGWKALGELSIGDRIATPRCYSGLETRVVWPEERIILLAHMIGDGCYASHQPVHYTSASRENLTAVAEAAKKAFGIEAREVIQKTWSHIYLTSGGNKWHRNPLQVWFNQMGIDGQRSHEKFIPEDIFSFDPTQMGLFLRHLWATDGCNLLLTTSHGHAGTIYYATYSIQLAGQVQHLLLRLGIQSRIMHTQKASYRPTYQVHITGKENQLLFAEKVGAFGDKQAGLEKIVAYIEEIKANPNNDTVPMEVWSQVKSRMKETGITQRGMAAMRGTSYGGDAHFGFAPTRTVVQNYATLLQVPELEMLAQSDVYWDTIVSIEPDGREDVYDIEVPGTHNFFANDILVHNSIEQDADIVMFIHRPDAMEKDSPRANVAELIVAKHRNGPTHPGIELIFRNNLARFENAVQAGR